MPNILTNLVNLQENVYGANREAFSLIDVASKKCIPTTWGDFRRDVDNMAYALEILGINPGDMVAIISHNCPEILISDFACYRNRAVPVSIYATSSADQIQYIVNDSGAKAIVVNTAEHYKAVRSIIGQCPKLERIIIINPSVEIAPDDMCSMLFDKVLQLGAASSEACRAEVEKRSAEAKEVDIATLIYTSGTTGQPKGAVLPHSCFDAAMEIHAERLTTISDTDTSVCFLPLSHIFEKAWTYFCLTKGMKVAINPNPKEIQQAVPIAKPTCMCSVPRFWEKVYTGVQDKIEKMKGLQRFMVERALKVGAKRNLDYVRLGLKAPWWLEMQYRFFDKKVFAQVRHVVGLDNGRFFPTAGAPLSSNIVEFLHAIGLNIVIGYGLSETTATVCCFPQYDFVIGSVGTTMPRVQVKLGENNEILVKGPTVMSGYYNRPDENEKAFTADGWLRTGDAGMFDAGGAIVLTERLKDLFKTSNGKYIAPQAIESRLGEDKYIEQVAVIGDKRKYVTAIIIPAFEALKEYARKKNINYSSIEDLIENSEIRKFIADRIERLQKGFAGFEKIKRFTLLPKEFSIEGGELTNTLKIRRPVINMMYADEIEAMYC
ncbi:MAG: long-chain fatty acid--CoA ligase [Muribaculaceae bacterium]|nr:long-chain fatty acid--CoA ligase [Muribaculaceae bacterium]